MLRLHHLAFVPVVLVLFLTGCGGGNSLATASVSGAVTYKGKPVTGGSVVFYPASGTPYSAVIAADGTYAVSDIPTGEEVVVCVETESINPVQKEAKGKEAGMREKMMGNRPPPPGQGGGSGGTSPETGIYVKIPEKYSKSKTSPITLPVKAGRQVFNIELLD